LIEPRAELASKISVSEPETTTAEHYFPAKQNKDMWDKLAAIAPIISGICVFAIGGYFTYVFNQQQLRIQEVQTIEKFLPRLAGDEQSKRAAILAISSLTNTELASHMAAIYASTGTASALQSIAQSGNPRDKSIASQALNETLEKIADNQSKLKDIEQDLKTALTQQEKNPSAQGQDLSYNLTRLADFYALKGQYDLAEPLLKRSLSLREKTYGPLSPQLIDTLKGLADLRKASGDQKQADAYLSRAREIEDKLAEIAPGQNAKTALPPAAAHTIELDTASVNLDKRLNGKSELDGQAAHQATSLDSQEKSKAKETANRPEHAEAMSAIPSGQDAMSEQSDRL
jgi:hypothetical protein